MKNNTGDNKDELDVDSFRTELNSLQKKIEQIEVKSNSTKGILDDE